MNDLYLLRVGIFPIWRLKLILVYFIDLTFGLDTSCVASPVLI